MDESSEQKVNLPNEPQPANQQAAPSSVSAPKQTPSAVPTAAPTQQADAPEETTETEFALPKQPFWRSKKMGVLAVILFLIVLVGGFVPVGKIPFLRNLVYAMGYSPDEAKHLSFLKALLTWNDHTKQVEAERALAEEAEALRIFDRLTANDLDKAQNKLINMKAVNASLAKRGKRADAVRGAYKDPTKGTLDEDAAVQVANADATANTQANNAKLSEVFFGEDASLLSRDKQDGYNSVNALKKIANAPRAGSSGGDKLDQFIDKAQRTNSDLMDLAKELNRKSNMTGFMGSAGNLGNTRAKRDLYHAWFMGRAGNRTRNVVLKKTLASASFDGAEMPDSVFVMTGYSGIDIRSDELNADILNLKKYLQQDKECLRAIGEGFSDAPTMGEIAAQISGSDSAENPSQSLASLFPENCGARHGSGYTTRLSAISNSCERMKSAYQSMKNGCATIDVIMDNSQCHSETLTTYYTAFDAFCLAKEQACQSAGDPAAISACLASVAQQTSAQDFAPGFNANGLANDIDHLLYQNENGSRRLNTGFFPGVNWNQSSWIDPSLGS